MSKKKSIELRRLEGERDEYRVLNSTNVDHPRVGATVGAEEVISLIADSTLDVYLTCETLVSGSIGDIAAAFCGLTRAIPGMLRECIKAIGG